MRAKLSLLTVVTFIVLVPGARHPPRPGDRTAAIRVDQHQQRRAAGQQRQRPRFDQRRRTLRGVCVIADNLVPNDTNFSSDVFVRDRQTDTIERVSVGPLGVEGRREQRVALPARQRRHQPGRPLRRLRVGSLELRRRRRALHRGRIRARPADAHDRAHQPRPGRLARRRVATRRRSAATDGSWRSDRSRTGSMPDGNPNFVDHVYVVDRLDARHRASGRRQRRHARRGRRVQRPISADGRVVAFDSGSGNLVAGDGDQAFDVFVHDRRTGRTEGISTRRPTETLQRPELPDLDLRRRPLRRLRIHRFDARARRPDGFFSDAFVFDRRASPDAPGEPQQRRRAGQRRQLRRARQRRRQVRRLQLAGEQPRAA